jgi:hypothetical protein
MDLVNLVIGVLATLISVFGLIYAALAAKRSDILLRRLVVYPFRELDIAFAALTEHERKVLLHLYTSTRHGQVALSDEGIDSIKQEYQIFDIQMLSFLEERRWIERDREGKYTINSDRLPYLHFLNEAKKRG